MLPKSNTGPSRVKGEFHPFSKFSWEGTNVNQMDPSGSIWFHLYPLRKNGSERKIINMVKYILMMSSDVFHHVNDFFRPPFLGNTELGELFFIMSTYTTSLRYINDILKCWKWVDFPFNGNSNLKQLNIVVVSNAVDHGQDYSNILLLILSRKRSGSYFHTHTYTHTHTHTHQIIAWVNESWL